MKFITLFLFAVLEGALAHPGNIFSGPPSEPRSSPSASVPPPSKHGNSTAPSVTPGPKHRNSTTARVTPVSDCLSISVGSDDIVCKCAGYTGLLPTVAAYATELVPTGLSVSTVRTKDPCSITAVTGTPTLSPPSGRSGLTGFPFSSTLSNDAIVAFQTITASAGIPVYAGQSTTVQSGTSMSVSVYTDDALLIGTFGGDAVYTTISNALEGACPTVTPGQTVSRCASSLPLTDVDYVYGDKLNSGGSVYFEAGDVSYSDPSIRSQLIAGVAAAFRAAALLPQNQRNMTYDGGDSWIVFAQVPSVVTTRISEQTEETGGKIVNNFLELNASSVEPLHVPVVVCSETALSPSILGVLSSVPGLDYLNRPIAAVAFAFGLGCSGSPGTW